MFIRALGIDVPDVFDSTIVSDFADVSDWAKGCVAFALAHEMINVGSDGSVNPAKNAKRDKTAMMLYMLLQYSG